ncbi:hypothetical protein [Fictibacillus sp. KU28468]|uniref:hypothetical protein n=1 Tax=Fictibacillus sp. KU28468 TaxID=2991053 RepID=UPI0006A78417|nr:hypothetical protein [Fictibacillus sp. KU28468]UZJ78664.1 hypothetical protein OKX00_21530 [Fictibacillus sp. KU28468]SFE62903.1 hypothetical protein SAMN05428981_10747 [Bacillus sp. OV194]
MKFSSSELNLGFLDVNKMGNQCKLSFGQTVRSRVFNTTKKTQSFGESNGDFGQHNCERCRVNDNDFVDGPTENKRC